MKKRGEDLPDLSLSNAQSEALGQVRSLLQDAVDARPNSEPITALMGDARTDAIRFLCAAGLSEKDAQKKVGNLINTIVHKTSRKRIEGKRKDVSPRDTRGEEGRQIHSHQGGPAWSLLRRDTIGGFPVRQVRARTPQARTPHS
ncbi:MAG TPA: hypothetical protein VN711_00430 [Candidatus Saccharimonadales bacterium]|nr:hypothetical protein [Candidatus Saccharimonadales bacterium]